jgi:putative peptidoglycan lipid II flippase
MAFARNFITVGLGTLSSRLLGFFRDILMASALGTGPVADAFFVAFRLPNLFRRIFAEGAFNSAYVPLFARALEQDNSDHQRQFASQALSGLTFILFLITILFELLMPLFMLFFAAGFADEPDKFELTVLLTRICFPYLLCVSLLALVSGTLNGLGRFTAAAFAPTLLNVILIGCLMLIHGAGLHASDTAGLWLSIGVLLGGVAQLAMVWIALERAGFALRFSRPKWTPGMKRLVQLGIPGVISGGITQINIVIGTIIATMQAGAVSYLYYADRIYQLPLGLVGTAMGVVLLPELTRHIRGGREEALHRSQKQSLQLSLLLTLPAAVALIVLAEPILQTLFERGAFDADDTRQTARALVWFAAGLPAFVLVKVFSPGFFARENTKTPMQMAALSVIVNVTASLMLFPFLGHVGLAMATSLAGWVNALGLYCVLKHQGLWTIEKNEWVTLSKVFLCALTMGLLLSGMVLWLPSAFGFLPEDLLQWTTLSLYVAIGLISYGLLIQLSGAGDLQAMISSLRKKKPAQP